MEFLRILPRRLLEQLSDLEKDRADLGEEEYSEMRQDTLEQVFYSLSWFVITFRSPCPRKILLKTKA